MSEILFKITERYPWLLFVFAVVGGVAAAFMIAALAWASGNLSAALWGE